MANNHPTLPQHLRAAELKRRIKLLVTAARSCGMEVGGVKLTPEGEITLLDKTEIPDSNKINNQWLGN